MAKPLTPDELEYQNFYLVFQFTGNKRSALVLGKAHYKMSPITKFKILCIIYRYFLRDLIITKIKSDQNYESLLAFTDQFVELDSTENGGDQWVS